MATEGSETADSMFDSSSLLETDEPSANETRRGDAVPSALESPATFHAFLATSCHKSTPLAVKKLLERSVTSSAEVSSDVSWSSSLATPSLIEAGERADSAEHHHVPGAVAFVSLDDAAGKAASALSYSNTECKVDPVPRASSPSSNTPGCDATAVNLTEDILSSFMCTPPSHKHKQGVIRRRLHAISTNRPSPDDGAAELDSWLTDEPRRSSERVTRQEPVACTHEATVSDLTDASTRLLDADAAIEMLCTRSVTPTRKRLSPPTDHHGADAEVPVAAGADSVSATSRPHQGSQPTEDVIAPELVSGSLMAKRRKFRYPRQTLKVTSQLGFPAHSSSVNQACGRVLSSNSGAVLTAVQEVPPVAAGALLEESLSSPPQQAAICRDKGAFSAQPTSTQSVVQPHINSCSGSFSDRDINYFSSQSSHAESQCQQEATDPRQCDCSHAITAEECTTTHNSLHQLGRNDNTVCPKSVLKLSPLEVVTSGGQNCAATVDAVVLAKAHDAATSLHPPQRCLSNGKQRLSSINEATTSSHSTICCTATIFPAVDVAEGSACTHADTLPSSSATTTSSHFPIGKPSHDLGTDVMSASACSSQRTEQKFDLPFAGAACEWENQRDIIEIPRCTSVRHSCAAETSGTSKAFAHRSSYVETASNGTVLAAERDAQQATEMALKPWSCTVGSSPHNDSNMAKVISIDSACSTGRSRSVTNPVSSHAFTSASGKVVAVSQSSLRHVKSLAEANQFPVRESVVICGGDTAASHVTNNHQQVLGAELQLCKSSARADLSAGSARVPPQQSRREYEAILGQVSLADENLVKTLSSWQTMGTTVQATARGSDAVCVQLSRGTGKSATTQESGALDFESQWPSEILTKPPQLHCGFSTASGKKVTISSEVLQKARALLSDPQSYTSTNSVCDPSTASEQGTIMRSTAAVSTTRLRNLDHAVPGATTMHEPQFCNSMHESAASLRFSEKDHPASADHELTFGGLSCRNEILARSTKRYPGDTESCVYNQRDNSELKSNNIRLAGFSTASGKLVRVSEEAIRKAKVVLDTVDKLPGMCADSKDGYLDCVASSASLAIVPPRIGFSTASGRPVAVSCEAMKQAKLLLDTVDEDQSIRFEDKPTNGIASSDVFDRKPCMAAAGFQTAAGKCVAVSSDALSRARGMLAEIDASLPSDGFKSKANPIVCGFKTASGKHMAVSLDSLAEVRSIFSEANSGNAPSEMDAKLAPKPRVGTEGTLPLAGTATIKTPVYSTPSGHETNGAKCGEASPCAPSLLGCSAVAELDSNTTEVLQLSTLSCDDGRRIVSPNVTRCGPSTPCRPATRFSGERYVPAHERDRHTAHQHFSFGNRAFTPHTPHIQSRQGLRSKSVTKSLGNEPRIDALVLPGGIMPGKQILTKKLGTVVPLVKGSGVCSKKKTFRDAFGNCAPGLLNTMQVLSLGVLKSVVEVNFSNAENFVFDVSDKCLDLSVAELGEVAAIGSSQIGKHDVFRAFLRMPDVDPKLVTESWVSNHYRWIIWKLASYERSFPAQFGGTCLTVREVIKQLKYRYQREIHSCERSCLKKILERDDDAKRRMVLVVTNAWHHGNKAGLILGDGWYSVSAEVDKPLELLIKKKLIKEGVKLCICNAELFGPADGCDPLEAGDSVKLKISANSTRRARWDAKLGFQRCTQPFTVPLCSLYADGGVIGCVEVVIARVYPLQFMEKVEGGSVIFRNAAAEDRAARKYQEQQKDLMEKAYHKVCKELASSPNATVNHRKVSRPTKINISCLTTGAEIFEAMETSGDPETLQQSLTEEQLEKLLDYQRNLCTKQAAAVQEKVREALLDQSSEAMEARNVTPLRRTRISGCHALDVDNQAHTLLTIWRPTADVDLILNEGMPIKLVGVTATETRVRTSSMAFQLSTRRGSLLLPTTLREPLLRLVYEPREVLSVTELVKTTAPPKYEELDISGVVISVDRPSSSLQTAVIADENFSFVMLKFLGGLEALGCNRIVTVGRSICVTSASWHADSKFAVPSLTVTELSTVRELEGRALCLVSAEFVEEALRRFGAIRSHLNNYKVLEEYNGGITSTVKQQPPVGATRPDFELTIARCRMPVTSSTAVPRSINAGSRGVPLPVTNGAGSLVNVVTSDIDPTTRKDDVSAEVDGTSLDDSGDGIQFSQIPDSVLSQMDQLEQTCLMLSHAPTAEGHVSGDGCKLNRTA